jgi:CBS domain-containing protein
LAIELRLEDVVVRKVVTISPEVSARDATGLMEEKSTSSLVVIVEGRIEGILTSRDVIQRVVAKGLDPNGVTVGEIATQPVIVLKPETFLGEAIKVMLQRRIKKIPLMSGDGGGRLVGLVSLSDIIEFHSELFSALWEQILMMEPVTLVEDEICAA